MGAFPIASWLNYDWDYQSLIIRNHPGVSALPYFSGTYDFGINDRVDFGSDNLLDEGNASAFVWKGGVIKYRVDKPDYTNLTYKCGPDNHWWYPFSITSGGSGSPSYHYFNGCCDDSSEPY